ncbi:MAG: type I restriction endonuclease, partial [Limnothrix sp.]
MKYTTENDIEIYNLELLENLGYRYILGYDIQPEGKAQERESFGDVVLSQRLQTAVSKINPDIPYEAQQQAIREVLNISSPELITNNEKFHRYLTEGITVEYQKDGDTRGKPISLIDWQHPENNEFLAINQFTISEDNHTRRPDIILFVNGLPLVVIELKNAADQKADTYAAFSQLQTYKKEIPSLFTHNALLVISDGLTAKAGSLSADYNRFMNWKTPSPSPSQGKENRNREKMEVPRPEG